MSARLIFLLIGLNIFVCLPSWSQVRYLDDLFPNVSTTTFEYAKKDKESLKLDVYEPKADTAHLRPVMVYIHGGGFSGGRRDGENTVRFMESLARKGYVAVSISYRLLLKGTKEAFGCDCPRERKLRVIREASKDFMDAVLFIKKNQQKFRIDPDKIIIGGSSAGAETVLNVAFMRDLMFAENGTYQDLKFAAVLSLAGAMVDVRYLTRDTAIPTILFHGTKDKLVPYGTAPHHYCPSEKAGYLWLDGSQTIANKLAAFNCSHLLYTFIGAGHEISGIPFEQMPIVLDFLKEAALDGKFRSIRQEKK